MRISMRNELTTRTMCLKAKSLSLVARSIQVTSSAQYFLVDLAYSGLTFVLPQYAMLLTNRLVPQKTTSTGTSFQPLTFTIKREMTR